MAADLMWLIYHLICHFWGHMGVCGGSESTRESPRGLGIGPLTFGSGSGWRQKQQRQKAKVSMKLIASLAPA